MFRLKHEIIWESIFVPFNLLILWRSDLPARAPGRLALPVRHRLRLRRMPGGLGWRASLQWQPGATP